MATWQGAVGRKSEVKIFTGARLAKTPTEADEGEPLARKLLLPAAKTSNSQISAGTTDTSTKQQFRNGDEGDHLQQKTSDYSGFTQTADALVSTNDSATGELTIKPSVHHHHHQPQQQQQHCILPAHGSVINGNSSVPTSAAVPIFTTSQNENLIKSSMLSKCSLPTSPNRVMIYTGKTIGKSGDREQCGPALQFNSSVENLKTAETNTRSAQNGHRQSAPSDIANEPAAVQDASSSGDPSSSNYSYAADTSSASQVPTKAANSESTGIQETPISKISSLKITNHQAPDRSKENDELEATAETEGQLKDGGRVGENEGDEEVEYEISGYVIEEIESTAVVSIYLRPTVSDLLAKLSNPLVLYFILFVLAAALFCALTEGEIPVAWTLAAVSIASLAAFCRLKL